MVGSMAPASVARVVNRTRNDDARATRCSSRRTARSSCCKSKSRTKQAVSDFDRDLRILNQQLRGATYIGVRASSSATRHARNRAAISSHAGAGGPSNSEDIQPLMSADSTRIESSKSTGRR